MSTKGPVLLPKFDPMNIGVLENPYPTYAKLRESGPLCRGGPAQWVVTRYAEIAALLSDTRLGRQFPEAYYHFALGDGPAATFIQRIILNRDPPSHGQLRNLMLTVFNARAVRSLANRIEALVKDLLTPLFERGRFDAVSDLAFPLPVSVICELIGIPLADRELVRPKAIDLSKAFAAFVDDEHRLSANSSILWLREYITMLLSERRKQPCNDMLSFMTDSEGSDKTLTQEDIVDNVLFLFFAGFETTTNLISNGCAALLKHPHQLHRLRTDPSLIALAVQEFMRYDAPIQSTARLALQPLDIGGRTIRKGRVLHLLLGSANHDERQFTDPEMLDVGRHPNPHVSFGGGIHHCLGAALATLEGQILFSHLLGGCEVFESSGAALRQPSPTFRAYSRVPITVRAV
jgi:cytochrome P450